MSARTALCLLVMFVCGSALFAQGDTLAAWYAQRIVSEELKEHLVVLASDDYQGRDTGREGQKMAAKYLKEAFVGMGIPPVPDHEARGLVDGYFQPYELIAERSGQMTLKTGAAEHRLFDGLLYFNEALVENLVVKELLFLGEGKTGPKGATIKDRDVLVDGRDLGKGEAALQLLRTRMEAVRKEGPRSIFVLTSDMASWQEMVHLGGTRMRLTNDVRSNNGRGAQLVVLDERSLDEATRRSTSARLRAKKAGRRLACEITLVVRPSEERVIAENVLAYIEGTDKKDELVVLTAHYDHIGVENGVVYNGADDDGSGTVALIEIAEAFAKAKAEGRGPRRSVLIMPVSGEEKGLLGSRHYSDHPVFPLENTVSDLNIDMIGRVDSAHTSSAPYVYIIGSDRLSTQLHEANERANEQVGLVLDYTFNDENDPNRFYYRSDHYNFARKGIPCIFYFSGVHEDYHQPGDDVEKIRFDLLTQRARLVFHTAWNIANREDRPVVDRPAK